jgi:translation initiation factor 3 subunit G
MHDRKHKIGELNNSNKVDRSLEKTKSDEAVIVRISNLSKNTDEMDVEGLAKPFGPVSKVYLAKDKVTGLCKGFAYVHFKKHCDAANAIGTLNGMGFDHLVLSVGWANKQHKDIE